jgi:hypothetical protein
MKRYLAVAAILLAVAPVRADNMTAGGGADLLGEFAGQFLGDLDNFAELTGQVLDMIEQGNSIIEQGQAIIDGFGPNELPNLDGDLTLGTMCLSHAACRACAQPHTDRANRAYEVLENNRVLLNNTMRKYEMLDTAASAAARGHEAAGAAYAIQQATQIGPARRQFFDNLTEAQTNALNLLGTTLFEIGACETEFLAVNTFAAISRNTLEIMKIKYLP